MLPISVLFKTIKVCVLSRIFLSTTLALLNRIDSETLKTQDVDLFYLNKLKNDVQELYYNHKSKPYKIAEVLKILDDKKYLFI